MRLCRLTAEQREEEKWKVKWRGASPLLIREFKMGFGVVQYRVVVVLTVNSSHLTRFWSTRTQFHPFGFSVVFILWLIFVMLISLLHFVTQSNVYYYPMDFHLFFCCGWFLFIVVNEEVLKVFFVYIKCYLLSNGFPFVYCLYFHFSVLLDDLVFYCDCFCC